MNCHSCSRKTLRLFIRSFTNNEAAYYPRINASQRPQHHRFFSATRSPREQQQPPKPWKREERKSAWKDGSFRSQPFERKEKEPWQIHKAAMKEKLGGEAWNPRKKLSPDTMEGIRHLHQTHPERFTTAVLADHFKVSPEAVRRILKSKWQPSDEEQEERLKRWDKRGENIWSNLVELGLKPPKRWREMGVGRAQGGQLPKWKGRGRNTVAVNDSVSDDIIPIVDSNSQGSRPSQWQHVPLSERML